MDNSNTKILQSDELIKEMQDNSAAIISALNDQWTTLQLLGGTIPTVVGVYSQFFSSMLNELSLQSGLASAKLGEQQMYDAAALESAAATYLLLDILSGNVEGVVDKLTTLASQGQGLLDKAGELPALLEKLGGGEKSDLDKSGDILTGGLNALGSIKDAGEVVKNFAGKGVLGLLPALVSGPALPVIIGAVTVAMGGFFAVKALKSGVEKEQAEKEATTAAKMNIPGLGAASDASTNTPPVDSDTQKLRSPRIIDPVDPFQTGEGADSHYGQYQQQADSSRQHAAELQEAVDNNAKQAQRLDEAVELLRRLVAKPVDRNITNEVVIQSVRAEATKSELREMILEMLKEDKEIL